MWSSSVTTGAELSIAGITAKTLAKEFGTPTFFIDEADFRERARAWDKALKDLSLIHISEPTRPY